VEAASTLSAQAGLLASWVEPITATALAVPEPLDLRSQPKARVGAPEHVERRNWRALGTAGLIRPSRIADLTDKRGRRDAVQKTGVYR
jgi:hypothetical protein